MEDPCLSLQTGTSLLPPPYYLEQLATATQSGQKAEQVWKDFLKECEMTPK